MPGSCGQMLCRNRRHSKQPAVQYLSELGCAPTWRAALHLWRKAAAVRRVIAKPRGVGDPGAMSVPPNHPALTPAALEALRRREAAQAAALRDNLRRRKQQARDRVDATREPDEPGKKDPTREP